MFINFSNHPSEKWDDKQYDAAKCFGEVTDVPFPNVSPTADEEEIITLGNKCASMIMEHASEGDTVMVQGEFSLSYYVINALKNKGIRVVSACSARNVEERVGDDGKTERKAYFSFVRFREYV